MKVCLSVVIQICFSTFIESESFDDGTTTIQFNIEKNITDIYINEHIKDFGIFPFAGAHLLLDYGIEELRFELSRGIRLQANGFKLYSTFNDSSAREYSWERLIETLPVIIGPIAIGSDIINNPISYIEIGSQKRVLHSPHQTICSGNILKVLSTLPCKDFAGLGLKISRNIHPILNSGSLRLSVSLSKSEHVIKFSSMIQFDSELLNSPTFASCLFAKTITQSMISMSEFVVSKRVRSTSLTDGEWSLTFMESSEEFLVVEFFPRFFLPLIKTIYTDCELSFINFSKAFGPRGGVVMRAKLKPHSGCSLSLKFRKVALSLVETGFAAEKGIEVSGCYYESLSYSSFSNGVLVQFYVSDNSMPYNTMAITTASIMCFFGAFTRSISGSSESTLIKSIIRALFKIFRNINRS